METKKVAEKTVPAGKTRRLFDEDSMCFEFSAEVIGCTPAGNGVQLILDRTAFFPEGGGQKADEGIIKDADGREYRVSDVQIDENGTIRHFLPDCPEGTELTGTVSGTVDSELRLRRMQNHTGEHIVSGLAHRMFGSNNVGFHLGSEMMIDLDTDLSDEQIETLETEANRAVRSDVRVTAVYPSKEELEMIDYRSKKEIAGDIRIVTIEGVDCCACCAPHVKSTGAVGMIKIFDHTRVRGGVRLTVACGMDALDRFRAYLGENGKISRLLSAKPLETAAAVKRQSDELDELKRKLAGIKKAEAEKAAAQAEPDGNGNIRVFADGLEMKQLQAAALAAMERCSGIAAVFSGNDEDEKGYNFVMASRGVPMREKLAEIRTRIPLRGGGDDVMVQGSIKAKKEEIEKAIF